MTVNTLAPVPVSLPLPAALAGRTVVVVGGSSGIGLAAGALLASAGARVTLVARDRDRLAAAVEQVCTPGATVTGIAGDGTDERDLERVLDEAGGPVDHLLVTAGGLAGGPFLDTPVDRLRQAVDGRFWGAYAAARAAARLMPPGGSVTFSSGLYLQRPVPGAAAAIAILGAVEGLTRTLAVELAPMRLRVNAVRYGVVDTPLSRGSLGLDGAEAVAAAGRNTPLGRFGTAQEAASAALFLMANNFATGTVLTVDGGQSLV
ncbi:SDR family oxidoreductase [Nonomuraea sp. NPDC005692]|uniref:SDR family oxidoreductase n=1 Tax=Nonomuraea sp. NPDC005692 TaxID=3157168 RepID=UPI0033DBEF5E